jgi:hypothetical protein
MGLVSAAMQESIFERVLTKLDEYKGRWDEVAEGSGVPLRTLEKIGRRETTNPGIAHVDRLFAYFDLGSVDSSRLKTKRRAG